SDGWESTHTAIEIVTDDMPFLLDSVGMELNRRGYGIHLLVHPVMRVRRGGGGQLTEVLPPHSEAVEGGIAESVIHVEVDRQTDPERLEALREHLLHVIGEVRAVVEDCSPCASARSSSPRRPAGRQPRWRRTRRQRRSSSGWRTTTSRSSASATTSSPTSTARCGSPTSRAPGSASSARRAAAAAARGA